jgi:hypothetical protein
MSASTITHYNNTLDYIRNRQQTAESKFAAIQL